MKRLKAVVAVLAIWVALVWFTVWDIPPSEWEPVDRAIVAALGIILAAFAAACPLFDKDTTHD